MRCSKLFIMECSRSPTMKCTIPSIKNLPQPPPSPFIQTSHSNSNLNSSFFSQSSHPSLPRPHYLSNMPLRQPHQPDQPPHLPLMPSPFPLNFILIRTDLSQPGHVRRMQQLFLLLLLLQLDDFLRDLVKFGGVAEADAGFGGAEGRGDTWWGWGGGRGCEGV